jgi:hypothetical protein
VLPYIVIVSSRVDQVQTALPSGSLSRQLRLQRACLDQLPGFVVVAGTPAPARLRAHFPDRALPTSVRRRMARTLALARTPPLPAAWRMASRRVLLVSVKPVFHCRADEMYLSVEPKTNAASPDLRGFAYR